MKKSKLLPFVLCVLLAFVLSACPQEPPPPPGGNNGGTVNTIWGTVPLNLNCGGMFNCFGLINNAWGLAGSGKDTYRDGAFASWYSRDDRGVHNNAGHEHMQLVQEISQGSEYFPCFTAADRAAGLQAVQELGQ